MTALMGIQTRLNLARLLFVTGARVGAGDLAAVARATFAGGVDIVELVDGGDGSAGNGGDGDDGDGARARGVRRRLEALETLRSAATPTQGLVCVHADADLAGEFSADLLLLADDSSSAAKARRCLHPWALIGRSCSSTTDIDAALADPDVSFLVVSANLSSVKYAAAKAPASSPSSKPWFAAGGITADYLGVLVAAGCRRVAVGRAIAKAKDPRAAASALKDALVKAWNDDPAMEQVTLGAFAGYGHGPGVIPGGGGGVGGVALEDRDDDLRMGADD